MKIPWEQIEELTKYLKEKGLTEISIETQEGKITIKKDIQGVVTSSVAPPVIDAQKKPKTNVDESKKSNLVEVSAPMVGTFFAASSPGSEPFVQVGSKVNPGTVLCIIEAMKIMNELPCEASGTVSEILVKDGQIVEFGQILMRITPT